MICPRCGVRPLITDGVGGWCADCGEVEATEIHGLLSDLVDEDQRTRLCFAYCGDELCDCGLGPLARREWP